MTESRRNIGPERPALLVMDDQPLVVGSLSGAEGLLSGTDERST
jgi:hypothetical protein